jgi:hypothetical protein
MSREALRTFVVMVLVSGCALESGTIDAGGGNGDVSFAATAPGVPIRARLIPGQATRIEHAGVDPAASTPRRTPSRRRWS